MAILTAPNGNVRYNSTTGALEVGGAEITVTDTVADWAELQAISKVAGNDNIVMHVEGLGVAGSDWRYKHDYTRWFCLGEPILALGYSAITHGATLTTEELAFELQLPNDYGGQNKSILQNGDFLIASALFTKTGTADAIRPNVRLDTASGGVTGTSIYAPSVGNTNIHVAYEVVWQRTSATTLRLTNQGSAAIGGLNLATATAYTGDVTVSNLDTSSLVYLKTTFKCASSNGDTAFKLQDYHVRMRAGRAG